VIAEALLTEIPVVMYAGQLGSGKDFLTDGNSVVWEDYNNANECLIRAVELRLRADVPIAFCMSGGIDSVSLISIARRIFDYDVHGFTMTAAEQEQADLAAAGEPGAGYLLTSMDHRHAFPRHVGSEKTVATLKAAGPPWKTPCPPVPFALDTCEYRLHWPG